MTAERDATPDGARPDGAPSPVPGQPRRSRSTAIGLTAVLVLAGLLFTTSAQTSHGTALRADRGDAAGVVLAEERTRDERAQKVATLTKEVNAGTAAEGSVNTGVAALQRKIKDLAIPVGAAPVRGPGVVVVLDDAPHGTTLQAGVTPDDLVVHQQDVQAVVNALWSGGAEAMMLMDQRVISTSAVQCVGNTLLLQGRVYSPPYRITAIGDPALLRKALALSAQVQIYQQYVSTVHLVFELRTVASVVMPGFDGSIELRYARVPSPSPSASGSGPGGTPSASGGP